MSALHVTISYDAAPDTVFAMLTDPVFLRAKYGARGETDIEIEECAVLGEQFRIVSHRTVAVDVPSFLRRVLHPVNSVTQTDIWDLPVGGARSGRWRVDIRGVPAAAHGTMRLEATGTGSAEIVDGTVSSSVPLLGGRIEAYVADTIRATLTREEQFAAEWLASTRLRMR